MKPWIAELVIGFDFPVGFVCDRNFLKSRTTLLDLRGPIPSFIEITDGRCHDVNALDALMAEPGAFYVMDRGYLDLDGFNEEDLYSNLAWLPHRHG
jgi:hypothetical protein